MSIITWYGHAAFRIEAGESSVIIDPFFAPDAGVSWRDAGSPDLILLTHDHGDHVGNTVEIARSRGSMVGAVVGTAEQLVVRGVPKKQILNGIGFGIGGTMTWKGISATMTQAFHSSESGVPVGYIVRMPDGLKVYHAGDTGIFSSMSLFGEIYSIDVALLPIGGVYTMDAEQAAHACKLLGCKMVIPMHWGTFPMLAQSAEEFRNRLAQVCPHCECLIMEPGQSREISF